ncbi:MAG: HAD family hydrolase [Phycisphaerae bacterium]|nr:HAD family hydrolase [Phycisphaerae bacterium]
MPRKYDGIIFDMDGTIVESTVDFKTIRKQFGIAPQIGIIEHIDQLPPDQAELAHIELQNRELLGAQNASLIPGAIETLDAVRAAGLKTALLTRNTQKSVNIIMQRFPQLQPHFDIIRTRENGTIKPQPDSMLEACKTLGLTPQRTLCVGDYIYDLQAANSANAVSVLITTHRDWKTFAPQADIVIDKLNELLRIIN